MTSPYGRCFSLPEAATFIGRTPAALYGLVRQRRITYHRTPSAPRVVTRRGKNGAEIKAVRGGDYFFYETELLAWIESTRVESSVVTSVSEPVSEAADLMPFMPAVRRFS